jgi:hypothetical protein
MASGSRSTWWAASYHCPSPFSPVLCSIPRLGVGLRKSLSRSTVETQLNSGEDWAVPQRWCWRAPVLTRPRVYLGRKLQKLSTASTTSMWGKIRRPLAEEEH